MRSYFARMFQYVAWADLRVIDALGAAPAAQAEALPLLSHLLAAEHIWLARLEHRPPCHAVWPTLAIGECKSLAAENEAGYRRYLEQFDERQLRVLVRYRNSAGHEFETPVIDILTQVVTHGPYHRGQIAKIVARNGSAAVNTDFITFARDTAPTA